MKKGRRYIEPMTGSGDETVKKRDVKKIKREAEVRNNADNLVYQTEKMLTDQAENISEEEKSTVQEKINKQFMI